MSHDLHNLDDLHTALEQRDQALLQSRQNLQLAERVIDASLEGIIITDTHNRIEFVNPAFTHLTGYQPAEVIGRTPAVLSSGRHNAQFYCAMWQDLRLHGYWCGEIWNRRKDGELYLQRLTITAINDEAGNISHYAALFTDITQLRENEERVRRLAYYDALTGLPNRRMLEDRLEQAIRQAQRYSHSLAVIFIDLDHFKQVNVTLGHAVGDELLLKVSERIRCHLRDDDTLARLGGDEFLVLLPELTELDEATRVARQLIATVSDAFVIDGHEFRVGCSLGISLYPDDGVTPEVLVKNADAAMYRAKQQGRNTYRLYRAEKHEQDHQTLAIETALRNSVETGEGLSVHYQPLIERDSGAIQHAEALLRWSPPGFGDIPPDEFIRLAERSGLISPLGQRAMQLVASQLQSWFSAGLTPPQVAINLSARQFWQEDLIEQVHSLFTTYDLPAGQIGFELTESILLEHQQQAVSKLTALRELGCQLALDDFGTGYSSLNYLLDLPLTTIKIDSNFIQQLDGEKRRGSTAIIAAITTLAKALGLGVVAEGVETEAQLAALNPYPIDQLQGYLIGPALSAAAFEHQWLAVPCDKRV